MKQFLLTALLVFSFFMGFGQCPPSGVFTSQAQIDQFAIDYPDCTTIEELRIEGADITDLSPLSSLTSVSGGGLNIIENPMLVGLEGLGNITVVTGLSSIMNNQALTDLSGLEGLVTVDQGNLNIDNNNSLITLQGLNNLQTATFSLSITNNESLESLEGLNMFTGTGDFEIIGNPSLTSLQGLDSLISVEVFFTISENSGLTSLNGILENVVETEFLSIEQNPLLTSLEGLENLVNVFDIVIVDNDMLESLDGFNPVSLFSLFIADNEMLINLNGLETLVSGDAAFNELFVSISDNPLLEDISGLSNIEDTVETNFVLTGNSALSSCAVDSVCNAIASEFPITFENNAPGCNTIEEVDMVCRPCDFPVILTSQEEVNSFPTVYADCPSELLFGLTISGDDIVDLSPLSVITSIQNGLFISDNLILESLSGFDTSLNVDQIGISNNGALQSLEGLEDLSSFFSLTISSNNSLTSLNGFPNIDFLDGELHISDNPLLEDISGMGSLTTIFDLTIVNNDSLESLAALSNLQSVLMTFNISDCDALTNLEGLQNVVSQGTSDVFLIVENNSNLQDISHLNNLLPESVVEAFITNNPALTACSSVFLCNYLSADGVATIENNAEGCNSIEEAIDSCDMAFNKIFGNIGFDFNNDGCDESDYDVSNILVTTTSGDFEFTSITNELGYYELFVSEGEFTTTVLEDSLPSGFNAAPESVTTIFTGLEEETEVEFCILGEPDQIDVSVSIIPLQEPRPGVAANYIIQYENKGTQILGGDITLQYDDAIMFFTESEVEPDSNAEGVLVWEYSDLLPFESRTFVTSFELFIPPVVEGGEELNSVITITPLDTDVEISDNTVALKETVVNSYDPNDKQVLQGEEIYEEQVGDYLDYLVRFQNTGTADALRVVVTDTLSDNLDWNTLRILSASHDYTVAITNGNEVSFIFEDINLPPEEQDEEGSNGHIAFEIRTLDNLVIGDSVENTANIFFDFNPPIITNTVVTAVAEPLGLPEILDDIISIYPNPVSERLTIQLSENVIPTQISLLSLEGKVLKSDISTTLDMTRLSKGIYFLQIETESGSTVKKVIKK